MFLVFVWVGTAFAFRLDGWNSPFLFFDPIESKWMMADPTAAVRDSVHRLQLSYVGFLPGGKSLIGLDARMPVSSGFGIGFLFSGEQGKNEGDFSFDQGDFNGNLSLNRGLYALSFATSFGRRAAFGVLPLLFLVDINGAQKAIWGGTMGIWAVPQKNMEMGVTSGQFFKDPFAQVPPFVSGFFVWKPMGGKVSVSQGYRFQKEEEGQYQLIGKIWVLKNAALRLGWDPMGYNGGLRLRIFWGTHEGFLEHYMGQGFYHHLHFMVRI